MNSQKEYVNPEISDKTKNEKHNAKPFGGGEQCDNFVVVGVIVEHEFLFSVDNMDGSANHTHTDVGDYPDAEIKQIPVEIGQEKDYDGEVVEVGVLE